MPVAAAIVHATTGEIIVKAINRTEQDADPTAHAEILVIKEACKIIGEPRIPEYDMYVTLEPCAMCAAAISMARIRRLYFGAYDPKSGGVDHGARIYAHSTCHHKPEVIGGIMEQECGELLKAFFKTRR